MDDGHEVRCGSRLRRRADRIKRMEEKKEQQKQKQVMLTRTMESDLLYVYTYKA